MCGTGPSIRRAERGYSGTALRYGLLRKPTQGTVGDQEIRPGGAGKPARGGRAWAAEAGRSDRQEAPGRPAPPPARHRGLAG
ncbi:MAG: hypothetical protein N2050_05870, partial [Flavobacteriales bacterium]|nr:hypothetical protein [Flavobacteriales bacterium]